MQTSIHICQGGGHRVHEVNSTSILKLCKKNVGPKVVFLVCTWCLEFVFLCQGCWTPRYIRSAWPTRKIPFSDSQVAVI